MLLVIGLISVEEDGLLSEKTCEVLLYIKDLQEVCH